MAVKEKAPMVLGIGAALAGVFLLFRKKKPALPEPPADGVVVGLWNPPSGAEVWQLVLTDWDVTVAINQVGGIALLDIAEAVPFEIPEGVVFPLRVVSLQVSRWNEDRTALIVLYEVQSFRPFKFDFDLGEFGDEPDPSYKEVFIPDYGRYYYNVSKERFED